MPDVRNFTQNISAFLNQESGGNGGIISVVSRVDSSSSTSSPCPTHHLKGTQQIDGPQWHILSGLCFFVLTISHAFSFGRRFRSPPIDVSFGSAICSDVTGSSTARTFSVSFTLLASFSVAFAWIVTRFRENFLSVPDFQTAQFSLFTFHRFGTSGVVVVVFIAQISHHHWRETTGTTVDDCHNVRLHLCIIWEQMLLCGQFFHKACEAHGEKDGQSFSWPVGTWQTGFQVTFSVSHVHRHLVSSLFSVSLFKIFPGLDGVREVVYFGNFRWRQDLPAVVQTPPSC